MTGDLLPWARIAPDRKSVIFTAARKGALGGIFTLNMDGSGKQAVPTGLERAWDGIYSPNGKHLAFSEWPIDENPEGKRSDVYIADADGSNRRVLGTYNGMIQVPAWSPDGGSIAYQSSTGQGNAEIVVVDVATGKFHSVSHHDRTYLDECPSWLPDGRLLIQSTRDGRFEVYVMNADGSNARALTK